METLLAALPALGEAFSLILHPTQIMFLIIGVVLGLSVGVFPGLGGIELPILGDLFGGTSGGQGLPRTAPGGGAEPTGPQVSELAALYDADLVGLMIPGMVVS